MSSITKLWVRTEQFPSLMTMHWLVIDLLLQPTDIKVILLVMKDVHASL